MNWNKIKFKKFITLQRGFDLPVTKMKDGKIPVLGSTCIVGYHDKAKVKPPGVITGRSGTIGVIQYIDKPYWPHNTSLWTKDFKLNYPKFVYYKMKTLNFNRFNGGASVPTLNRNNLDNLIVLIPDVKTQKKIAEILSNYDEPIDINHRRIQLLEESARLLFREWFVYFRFPGHKKVKIVDDMPEEWEATTVKECISFISRGPSINYISEGEDEGIPVLNQRCIRNGKTELDSVEYAKELSIKQQGLYVKKYDILINSMGEGTLGRVSRNLSINYPMIIHNCITVVRANENIIKQAVLFYRLRAAQKYLERMGLGSTGQTSLKKEVIARIKILIPPKELQERFDLIIKPFWLEIGVLKVQNQKLAQARDLLLPRLMNGTIDVSELNTKIPEEA